MSDVSSPYADNCAGRHCRRIVAALACLVLWFSAVLPGHAAEPVEVVVTGIEGDVLKNVQDSLILPTGLVRDGKVDQRWLERFAQQVDAKTRTALEPFGYYTAHITSRVEPAGEGYRLMVTVVPGEPVRLTEVTVNVAGPGTEERRLHRLIAAFPLKKGDVLQQQKYEEAKSALKLRARDLGYLDAEFSQHEIRIAKSATTATIKLLLNTGKKYYFGETTIKGAPDYPDSFLRRHLAYSSGDSFSYPRLGETQRNFTNSERFKEVIITPEKQDAEAFSVPVSVQLKQGPRISLRPGIGYGTDTGARLTLRYRDLNMFHLGHELYSNLFIAERLQGLVTGYIIPSPTDIKSSTTLQLNLQREETTTYLSR
ncbi:MAG: POTRA domain-containing protein, partial [Desulfuromonadaceae bacterium]|nr:POTRA domain-containing protein [Desulfuromonadaceae bacterium]